MTTPPQRLEVRSADARPLSPERSLESPPPATFAPLSRKLSGPATGSERVTGLGSLRREASWGGSVFSRAGRDDANAVGVGRDAGSGVVVRASHHGSDGRSTNGPLTSAVRASRAEVEKGGGVGEGKGGSDANDALRQQVDILRVSSSWVNSNGEGTEGDRPDAARPPHRSDGGGGGDSNSSALVGNGGDSQDEPPRRTLSSEHVPVQFIEAPTSARVMVGSYSIGGEEWWGEDDDDGGAGNRMEARGDGDSSEARGSGGGGSSGGALSPTRGRSEDEKSPYMPGQGGAGGGPSPGGAGVGGGSSSAEGGDGGPSPAPRAGGNGGGKLGEKVEAGGANGEGDPSVLLPVAGRPLGGTRLVRSITDLQNMPPPSLLRQTSKYLHEDLAEAKRRQNQRARAKRHKRLSFADEHGDALFDTEYQQGLYYSKEGVPAPRKQGGCCTIS